MTARCPSETGVTGEEFLRDDEILARGELTMSGARGIPAAPDDRPTGVRCGHPLIYPIATGELPLPLRRRSGAANRRYAGALFAFDLDPPAPGRRNAAARFHVTLSGSGARAVQLAEDGDDLGLVLIGEAMEPASPVAARTVAATRNRPAWLTRLAGRQDTARAWTTGAQTPSFGWVYEDPRGRLLLPRTYAMHALLELPPDATEVAGAISIQVETTGPGGRRRSVLSDAISFTEPIIESGAPDSAAVRLCMAADVVGYSRRPNDETERLQRDLVDVLGAARRAAAIADSAVRPQPQGDGQFTVLPVGLDESAVIPALLHELATGLARRDATVPATQRMRLRVALHRGLVKEGSNGWVGNAAIAVHRILDSPPLRAAVQDNPAASYVLGVPEMLFRDVIAPAVRSPSADDFREMVVDLPTKNYIERGWFYVGPEFPAH
jgi:hypothetical protein